MRDSELDKEIKALQSTEAFGEPSDRFKASLVEPTSFLLNGQNKDALDLAP